MNPDSHSTNSIVGLLRELRNETTNLLRQEVELAKAEISERVNRMATNAVNLAIGAFVAYAGLIVVLFGLGDLVSFILIRAGTEPETAVWAGRIAVGLIVVFVGWLLLTKAKKAISQESLVPEKTLQSLEDNKEWAENKLQQSHES